MHVLSPTGSIMFCTPSIRELTGWTPEEAVGKPISDFIRTLFSHLCADCTRLTLISSQTPTTSKASREISRIRCETATISPFITDFE